MISEAEFQALEDTEAEWLARERKQTPDPDLWRWSPTPLPKFREMLATATIAREIMSLSHTPRFFEAGCGVGTKLYIAQEMFELDASGWELYEEYVEHCAKLGVKAEQHDLRTEDPDWASYDIVFISRPFKDDEEERRWEQKVQDAMRPGAVLMASFAGVKPYSWRWLYRAPWRIVAVKPQPDEAGHASSNLAVARSGLRASLTEQEGEPFVPPLPEPVYPFR